MGVVAETMTALVLADEVLRKFGGDSVGELVRNHHAYQQQVRDAAARVSAPAATDDAPLNWDETLAFDATETGADPTGDDSIGVDQAGVDQAGDASGDPA
jgi:hypothetical protein